jgi:hypothetical protein
MFVRVTLAADEGTPTAASGNDNSEGSIDSATVIEDDVKLTVQSAGTAEIVG